MTGVRPIGEKFDFFSPSGSEIQSNYKSSEIKLFSVGALKGYLNEKNLMQGRETATISKFIALTFETYFSGIITMVKGIVLEEKQVFQKGWKIQKPAVIELFTWITITTMGIQDKDTTNGPKPRNYPKG